MNALIMLSFAAIAAVGNAMFALGQKDIIGTNRLLFVGCSAFIACALALASSFLLGMGHAPILFRDHSKSLLLSGSGLFLTYLGFNFLYIRFGVSYYVVYAAASIITTTIGVGFIYLKEPVNSYYITAVLLSVAAIIAFAIGQRSLT